MQQSSFIIGIGEKDRSSQFNYEKWILVPLMVWGGVFLLGFCCGFHSFSDEDFNTDKYICMCAVMGVLVDVVIINIWVLRFIINKVKFWDSINNICSKCKNLMCIQKGQKIKYQCVIRHRIINSNICKSSREYKQRTKNIPFDKLSFIRRYGVVTLVTSLFLIFIILVLVPFMINTGKVAEICAYISIFLGTICLFTSVETIYLWSNWWIYRQVENKKMERIVIFNEVDENESENNTGHYENGNK